MRLSCPKHSKERILLAGCGGGKDIFGGLPLYFEFLEDNTISLLSLSTSASFDTLKNCQRLSKFLYLSRGPEPDYEGLLAYSLRQPIYIIPIQEDPTLKDLIECYEILFEREKSTISYLIDGGCDVLLKGNEQALATPVEDMMSLWALISLSITIRFSSLSSELILNKRWCLFEGH